MSITRQDPNTIWLGGEIVIVNEYAASEAITPGMLIDSFNNGGIHRYRKATPASIAYPATFALDQPELNKGVDDAYAANDLVKAGIFSPGAKVWALIASGQTIVHGNKLEAAADGTLKIFSAGIVLGKALENKTATALTRIRVEVV